MPRFVEISSTGEYVLTKNFEGNDVPNYAILSHTWGPPEDEVGFDDFTSSMAARKPGSHKVRFCGEQAKRDGLRYFWIDTCCIDKANNSELSEAINSMFKWYANASKCYVYLSDVSHVVFESEHSLSSSDWRASFRKSRWFTRGWTLQELLAPPSVDFFSKEGQPIGNRESLNPSISKITGIPATALRGRSLSGFSVAEKFSWQDFRNTAKEEDQAYSLLGIFDVSMPLIYGEGREKAFKRLRREIEVISEGEQNFTNVTPQLTTETHSTTAKTEADTGVVATAEDYSIPFSISNAIDIEHFVARETELEQIHGVLRSDGTRRVVILHGLGGIGKTQLAIAYAKLHKNSYSGVFWFNAKDEDTLRQSFATVAMQVLKQHPSAAWISSADEMNLDEVVNAVKAWFSLSNNTRWLIIYDNHDNPKMPGDSDRTTLDLRCFLPESCQGSVIITTRSSRLNISGKFIRITKLTNTHHSLEILSNTSGRNQLGNDADAVRLVQHLDGLPLAIATAGAYLYQVAVSFQDYLHLYQELWAQLQKNTPALVSYEDRTLYSTWQISFEYIKERNELSAKLLQFWAYFDNQDVWYELLHHRHPEDPDWIHRLMQNELSFHAAMRVLCDYGLAEAESFPEENTESRGYSIHSCVHSWTIHVLNFEWDRKLARSALQCLASHVQANNATNKWWLGQRRLLRHAARCYDMIFGELIEDSHVPGALRSLGSLYAKQAKLDEAEKLEIRALASSEKIFGLDDKETLQSVSNLAVVYRAQGRLTEARKMCFRALSGREKALGSGHLSTLDTINNLAIIFMEEGKLNEAEEMYERVLAGSEKIPKSGHKLTLRTLNNLAILYKRRGELDNAETMYKRALAAKRETLGSDHTSTLQTVNNLAHLYTEQEKLEEAEEMHQQAMKGFLATLGEHHASTVKVVRSLCSLYRRMAFSIRSDANFRLSHGPPKIHRNWKKDPKRILSECASLCQQLFPSNLQVYGDLGRILMWLFNDDSAMIAFERQIELKNNEWWHSSVLCDGCNCRSNLQTGRLICRSCMDVDLCHDCHQKYDSEDLKVKECQGHVFLESPRPIWKVIPSGMVSLNGETVETWLEKLKAGRS